MLAVPFAKLRVGVKVPVLVRPVPLMTPSVPPVTVMSPAEPFHINVLPGSSENVNVMFAVSPVLSVETLLPMLTVGAKVSRAMLGDVPALPVLPALSV